MRTLSLAIPALPLLLAATVPAQIMYVDADHNTNTTLADGSPFSPSATVSSADNNWSNRTFANNGTIYSSNDTTVSGFEDAPMLRTTISGLVPGLPYLTYSYLWGAGGVRWRGRTIAAASQPSPELPGYNSIHSPTSSFSPTTALGFDAPTGPQTALLLGYDAAGFETDGHFANQVLIQEGNRWLYEVPLGTVLADVNGEIHVYFDDLANTSSDNRTWFDGVGYEIAPLSFGSGCGTPSTPTIDYIGSPLFNADFTITQSGATPNAPTALALGTSMTTWGSRSLPFDLGPLGFFGCFVNVSADGTVPLTTDSAGDAEFTLNISGIPAATFYWQWLTIGSNGLEVTTGLQTVYHR